VCESTVCVCVCCGAKKEAFQMCVFYTTGASSI
jgi:hypothetical protein